MVPDDFRCIVVGGVQAIVAGGTVRSRTDGVVGDAQRVGELNGNAAVIGLAAVVAVHHDVVEALGAAARQFDVGLAAGNPVADNPDVVQHETGGIVPNGAVFGIGDVVGGEEDAVADFHMRTGGGETKAVVVGGRFDGEVSDGDLPGIGQLEGTRPRQACVQAYAVTHPRFGGDGEAVVSGELCRIEDEVFGHGVVAVFKGKGDVPFQVAVGDFRQQGIHGGEGVVRLCGGSDCDDGLRVCAANHADDAGKNECRGLFYIHNQIFPKIFFTGRDGACTVFTN